MELCDDRFVGSTERFVLTSNRCPKTGLSSGRPGNRPALIFIRHHNALVDFFNSKVYDEKDGTTHLLHRWERFLLITNHCKID